MSRFGRHDDYGRDDASSPKRGNPSSSPTRSYQGDGGRGRGGRAADLDSDLGSEIGDTARKPPRTKDVATPTSHPGRKPGVVPSYKVQSIAKDIASLEYRCQWLEERNVWLTEKLLSNQRRFVDQSVLANLSSRAERYFKAWASAMPELVLERTLEEKGHGLEECQQVAKELGNALTREQKQRGQTEELLEESQSELQRMLQEQKDLHKRQKINQIHYDFMEKRVAEAEAGFTRFRTHATSMIHHHEAYSKKMDDLEQEAQAHPELQAMRGQRI